MIDDKIMKKIRFGLLGLVVVGSIAGWFGLVGSALGLYLICLETKEDI